MVAYDGAHMWERLVSHHHAQPTAVSDARRHAIEKHGAVRHTPHEWLAIITEEVGEAATELNEAMMDPEGDQDAYMLRWRLELAQAAAMCIHALIDSAVEHLQPPTVHIRVVNPHPATAARAVLAELAGCVELHESGTDHFPRSDT